MRERSKTYRHSNIEITRKRDLEQYYKRRDKELIRMKEDYHKNITHNRRYNKTHDISNEQWEDCLKYFNYLCAYCGIAQEEAKSLYNNNLHKEHVDHEGENDLSNCVPSCKQCNSEKRQFALEEWYNDNNSKYSKDKHLKLLKWLNKDYKKFI